MSLNQLLLTPKDTCRYTRGTSWWGEASIVWRQRWLPTVILIYVRWMPSIFCNIPYPYVCMGFWLYCQAVWESNIPASHPWHCEHNHGKMEAEPAIPVLWLFVHSTNAAGAHTITHGTQHNKGLASWTQPHSKMEAELAMPVLRPYVQSTNAVGANATTHGTQYTKRPYAPLP